MRDLESACESSNAEPVLGLRLEDVEILGVEAIFEGTQAHRGTIWMPIHSGLTALYGRNGAGKTTVLEAVRSALSGVKVRDMRCRVYLRLLATDAEMAESEANAERKFQDLLKQWEEEADSSEEQETLVIGDRQFPLITGPPARPTGKKPPFGWYFQKLIAAVPKGCEFFDEERTLYGSGEVPGWEHPSPKLSREQIDAEEWADFQLPTWVEVVRLLLLGNAAMDEAERASWIGDGGSAVNSVNEDVYRLCREVEGSGLLCFEANGTLDNPKWEMKLAAQVVGDTAGRILLEDSLKVLDDDQQGHTEPSIAEHVASKLEESGLTLSRETVVLASVLGSSLLVERARAELSPGTLVQQVPYAALGREWSSVTLRSLPVMVKSVDSDAECDVEVSRLLRSAAGLHETGSLLIQYEIRPQWPSFEEVTEVQYELPNVDSCNEQLEKIAQKLRGIGVGISGLRVVLNGGIRAALVGGMLTLEVQDSISGTWLATDRLSSAQRSWLAFVLSLNEWKVEAEQTILLADEVDRGAASRAISPMMMLLESLYPSCLFATHSPSALRSGIGRVQHVHRDPQGAVHVSEPSHISDTQTAAEQLGISPGELLTFLQAVVLVEGEHDRIIIQSMLEKVSPSSGLDTRVVPFRGVDQLVSVDARLLLEYTDATVVLLVDASRQSRIDQALEAARAVSGRKKTHSILRSVTAPLRQGDASKEELVLAEVIEQALSRGILHRVLVVGLDVPDILEVLDPGEFGLERPWSEYRMEWTAGRKSGAIVEEFKSYLRSQHGARINVDAVRMAADRLLLPPRELSKVFETIEVARFNAGLNALD